MQVIKIKASTHRIYGLSKNQQRKAGIYHNLAMPFDPEKEKCFLFNYQSGSYDLIGREISYQEAISL